MKAQPNPKQPNPHCKSVHFNSGPAKRMNRASRARHEIGFIAMLPHRTSWLAMSFKGADRARR